MPRPSVATMSRWTSFTPPPKVLIWQPRASRSTRPCSSAPGEPLRTVPCTPSTSSTSALPAFDVELAAFLIDPSAQRTTSVLAGGWLGRTVRPFEEVAGRGAKAVPAAELPIESVSAWAGEEAAALAALAPKLEARLESDGLASLFEQVEIPLTAVLSAMEREGVRIDEKKLHELSAEYDRELSAIAGRIEALAGEAFQINSPKQQRRRKVVCDQI